MPCWIDSSHSERSNRKVVTPDPLEDLWSGERWVRQLVHTTQVQNQFISHLSSHFDRRTTTTPNPKEWVVLGRYGLWPKVVYTLPCSTDQVGLGWLIRLHPSVFALSVNIHLEGTLISAYLTLPLLASQILSEGQRTDFQEV